MAAILAIATPAIATPGRDQGPTAATEPFGLAEPQLPMTPPAGMDGTLRAETPADMVIHEGPLNESEASEPIPFPLPSDPTLEQLAPETPALEVQPSGPAQASAEAKGLKPQPQAQSDSMGDNPAIADRSDPLSQGPDSNPRPETNATDHGEAPSTPSDTSPNATSSPTQEPGTADPSAQSPEDIAREQQLMEADALYQAGQLAEAEALYRQAKSPFPLETAAERPADPILDPALLPPGGKVYWRESTAGLDLNLETRTLVPLKLLVQTHPEFVPGHLRYAEALRDYEQPEDALAVLERAAVRYPNQPDLQKGLSQFQAEAKKWLEASITARQFTLLNPDHPDAPEFAQLAEDYHKKFRSDLRSRLTNNIIGGILSGAVGLAVTGNPFSTLSTVQTSLLLLRGETAVGNSVARRARKQLPLIEDPEVQAYVNRIGQKLVALSGRDFNYEFYVVKSKQLNAFALPGGKIFINGGAIVQCKSEAELAGLIAHEISHAELSHGFQLVTQGNTTANITQLIPFVGGLVTNVAVTDYSREMEQQADLLGTRMLASAGYAADGLRDLMVTLAAENKSTPFPLLATHPVSQKRVRYLEALIEQNGYNRYAYVGIAEHKQIQAQVKALLADPAPDTETPDAETPDAETPDTETPDAETPNTEISDTETPDTEISDTEIPEPAAASQQPDAQSQPAPETEADPPQS